VSGATRSLGVLHLVANRWWTGSADPVIQLALGLQARGHRVRLGIVPGDRFETKAREAGLEVLGGLGLEPRFAPLGTLRDLRRLRALFRAEPVDVVHAHHSHDHWLALLARPAGAGRRRAALVRTFHNLRAVRRDGLSRRLYARTGGVLAASRQIEARCREVGIPGERVRWIPGVVDLRRFTGPVDGRPIREEFKLDDAPVVVSVARLAPNRGHELLLSAFRRLLGTMPSARLLLVGKGETRPRLEQLVVELGLAPQVIFTGYRDRDLPVVLAAADCFALMGAGSDDSCRAVLEAMAAGRPVVARRVGALPETVVEGETGFLVDDQPDRVAAALAAVLGDPARGRAMGAAGRRRAERDFTVERSVDTVEAMYRALT
jgi:glycosyltransferase involved in cell wall biosynthesis